MSTPPTLPPGYRLLRDDERSKPLPEGAKVQKRNGLKQVWRDSQRIEEKPDAGFTYAVPITPMTPTNQPKMICHAPGDQCHGCDHSHGKADVCRYAPQPMIDTKTPIKAAEEMARLQMIRGSDVLDAAAIIRSHIAAELTAANERNAALERASLTTQEKDQCAKAIQTAMNPSGSLFIPKGWNVILAKLEGNLEGAEKCIGMHTANLEYEITQLRERNAKLLALATKMLDGLAHDEGCFLHGSTVYDEAECSCEAKLFATALAELKGEK